MENASLAAVRVEEGCSVPALAHRHHARELVLADHHHPPRARCPPSARRRCSVLAAMEDSSCSSCSRARCGFRAPRARVLGARMHHRRSSAACIITGARLHDASLLLAGEGPCSRLAVFRARCSPTAVLASFHARQLPCSLIITIVLVLADHPQRARAR
ncbi:hypothetical protein Dimus_039036 [Dionaea muscipula]